MTKRVELVFDFVSPNAYLIWWPLRALVNRYGKSLFFDFKYVNLNTGVKVWGQSGGSKSAKRVQRDQVYPAIQFFKRPNGLPN